MCGGPINSDKGEDAGLRESFRGEHHMAFAYIARSMLIIDVFLLVFHNLFDALQRIPSMREFLIKENEGFYG